MEKIVYNGNFLNKGTTIVSSENRGLRFGDGCFETIKVMNGKIILNDLHFARLLSSLELLGFNLPQSFNAAFLSDTVMELLKSNKHHDARVRINVFRGNVGLPDSENDLPNYVIESWKLDKSINDYNEKGLVVDIYKDARKSCDHFSYLKSNNFLPYIMAAKWAKVNQLDDSILLNAFDRIADATIANVFIVQNGILRTPAITEGCVAGVMRKFLINACRKEGIPVEETTVSVDDLQNASEIFLTNVIRGIRWIRQIGEINYTNQVSKLLHRKLVKCLWT
jgi:branched-subunit amino acid aminotransferase/4-amino-4-deoxychorismate lyase